MLRLFHFTILFFLVGSGLVNGKESSSPDKVNVDSFFDSIDYESNPQPEAYSIMEQVKGFLRFQLAYNTEENRDNDSTLDQEPGFTKIKASFSLEKEDNLSNNTSYKIGAVGFYDSIYQIDDNESVTAEEKNTFESEIELSETYVRIAAR